MRSSDCDADLPKSKWDRNATNTVLRLEPFTGIRQVAIENLLPQYRDKLDALKLPPRALSDGAAEMAMVSRPLAVRCRRAVEI